MSPVQLDFDVQIDTESDVQKTVLEDHAPTIDHLIIPHPSFRLQDIVTFEMVDPRITERGERVTECDTSVDDSMIPEIQNSISSYVYESLPIPSLYSKLFPVLVSLFNS